MKTLILNGSPRKNGNTQALLNLFTKQLTGEYKTVNAYYSQISPCIDCRYCQKHGKCCKKDGMEEIYSFTRDCDNILIASSVFFSELTPPLLGVLSRFQAFYCSRRFLGNEPVTKKKKGALLLMGGGDGDFDLAEKSGKILLKIMGAEGEIPLIYCGNTDFTRAEDNEETVKKVLELAEAFEKQI